MKKAFSIAAMIAFAGAAATFADARADEAEVLAVNVTKIGDGVYRFDVTVSHADAGWSHYADRWQVLSEDGDVLGERVLLHPHDNEQPFTRAEAVKVPPGTARVRVRAHDNVHGFGGAAMTVEMPRD